MDAYFCIGFKQPGEKEYTIIMERYETYDAAHSACEYKALGYLHRQWAVIQYAIISEINKFLEDKNPAPDELTRD